MPDSLLFDGDGSAGGDRRDFTAGDVAGNGALSIVAIVKPVGAYSNFFTYVNWNTTIAAGLQISTAGVFNAYDGTNSRTGPTIASDEWWLLGYTKAVGTVTPRYHAYRYSTATWAHGAFSGTHVNWPALTTLRAMWSAAEAFAGNMLMLGVWDSELSDASVESLEEISGAWIVADPDECWRFDKTGSISSLTGTSTQSGAQNETLDVGDAPTLWSDDAGIPAFSMPQSRVPMPMMHVPGEDQILKMEKRSPG